MTDPQPVAAPGPPGAAAVRFLRGTEALQVQVLVQAGAEPRAATLDHLLGVLRRSTSRPVTLVRSVIEATRDRWSDADVRTAAGRPPAPVLRLLFLRGASATGADVLGLAVQENAAAVFVERVRASSTPLVNAGALEAAVTTHELGHLLGLVDLVLRTGRADREHPGHSTNRSSVMFWAVESDVVGAVLTGGPPTDFDDADRADLRALREG